MNFLYFNIDKLGKCHGQTKNACEILQLKYS